MSENKSEDFARYFRGKRMKVWGEKRGSIVINFYQLLWLLIAELNLCKIRILEQTYLAIKKDNVVELVDKERIAQELVHYIENEFPDDFEVVNKIAILDKIVENSPKYYDKHVLNHLTIYDTRIKLDTKTNCYIPYENGMLDITKSELRQIDFRTFPHPILKSRIIRRKFERTTKKLKGDFVKFLWNLAGHSPYRFKVLCTTMGYLVHTYKDPAIPKMVILIDQVIGELETNNGGSGKSLCIKALGKIRNVVELSGKRLTTTNRFAMQRVDAYTDIILVNDAKKYENLDDWYNFLSDGMVIERKYLKEIILSAKDSPKIALTSNHMIIRSEGNSSERRVHELEISDHYGKDLTPQEEFGRNLFDDFNDEDWYHFDNFIVFCVQYYLQFGLLTPPVINILKRKLIAEVGIELVEFMDEKIQLGTTKFHKKDTYDEFVKGGFIDRKYIPQRNSFTRKLRKYFEYKELSYSETPSDSKKYFELVTEQSIEEMTTQTIKNKEVKYSLINTDNKLTRLTNNLKTELK